LSENADILSLYEERPAKGSGWVGITVKTSTDVVIATLFESRHSEKSLNWLKTIQPILALAFDLKTEYEDLGYNA
jgi:hypothetical protein